MFVRERQVLSRALLLSGFFSYFDCFITRNGVILFFFFGSSRFAHSTSVSVLALMFRLVFPLLGRRSIYPFEPSRSVSSLRNCFLLSSDSPFLPFEWDLFAWISRAKDICWIFADFVVKGCVVTYGFSSELS